MTRGDDLEDDFILDDNVVLSEDEESSEGHDPMSTQSEEPESSTTQITSEKTEKKRKRREKEREKFKERKVCNLARHE
jgi:protein CMS1